MQPPDYDGLWKNIDAEARPKFVAFVARHGLTVPEYLGRYPRLRAELERVDGSMASINFEMAYDDAGQYFTSFREDLPYELSGGITIDRPEPEGLVRYGKFMVVYDDRPFRPAMATFETDLEDLWSTIKGWNTEIVYSGRRTVIQPRAH